MTERIGRWLFAVSIFAIGAESIVLSHASLEFVKGSPVLPIMPYPPAGSVLAVLYGIVTIACAVMMLRPQAVGQGVMVFAALYVVSALLFDLPRMMTHFGSVPLRTLFFQPLALAALAWMLPDTYLAQNWVMSLARYCIAIALIVFGVDHFLAFNSIESLVPGWMPFHAFWAAFFGVAFAASGLSFATNLLRAWAAAALALMFAIFEVTLHVPALLTTPGALSDPDAWCSVFIVSAFCGGFLALATVSDRVSD